jgi:hypothetical protein
LPQQPLLDGMHLTAPSTACQQGLQ